MLIHNPFKRHNKAGKLNHSETDLLSLLNELNDIIRCAFYNSA